MKKQFLSVLAFSAILLSSCGGTAKIEKASACGQEGEITASSATAIAETESGKVAGYVENGIYIYKGIPYAKAERFMPPVAADKWEGVRSSRAYGPTCPQGKRMGWYSDEQAFAFNWDDGYPDENCLRVNIWTPGLKDGKKRPVMVWLHGGGYSAGSGQELPSYDGTNLAKKGDAVVVTLNHRLNVLGFLDLSAYGDKYAKSGNAGLLDLVAALQWVNKNIESFGGDARNVTIFGQSGGGGKVSTLLATPSARGLFHKAIVQSGSMLRTMEQKYSRRIGSAVMEELGLKASQIDELCKMPYDKVLAAGDKAIAKVRAEAEKEKMIREAEGQAEAIMKVQQANADGIRFLKEAGADVTIVRDGQQAVDLFIEKPEGTFDAILMDIQMPVMDGIEASKKIRMLERPDARLIPIIALTANVFDVDVQRSKAVEMKAHLVKPIDPQKRFRTLIALWK